MKYQKIPNLFKLDEKFKHYDGNAYDNEHLDYVSNLCFHYQEKLDGTNIRVCWDGYNISFKGRTDEAQIPPFLFDHLTKLFENKDTVFERLFGEKEVILFGEGIGYKIQSSKREDNDFVLFDIAVNGVYIGSIDTVNDIAKEFAIKSVPYKTGRLTDIIEECLKLKNTQSDIVKNTFEGFVIRPQVPLYTNNGHRIIAKLKAKYL